MKTSITLVMSALLLAGCSGKIITSKKPHFENNETEGILFYIPKLADKKVVYDLIRNKKYGQITHSAYAPEGSAQYCEKKEFKIKVTVPNYAEGAYSIRYEAGLFETVDFGVAFEKGMITSVNTKTVPGVSTAITALKDIASLREGIMNGIAPESAAADKMTHSSIIPVFCTTNE